MTDIDIKGVKTRMDDSITKFVNNNKHIFTNRLTEQVATLSSKLDPSERKKLRDLSVAKVVEDVSQKVIDVVVEQNSVLLEEVAAIPLYILPVNVTTRLLGKRASPANAPKILNGRLVCLAAVTYAAETARALLDALSRDVTADQTDQSAGSDSNEKSCASIEALVSEAALNASPVSPMFDADGLAFRLTLPGISDLPDVIEDIIDWIGDLLDDTRLPVMV